MKERLRIFYPVQDLITRIPPKNYFSAEIESRLEQIKADTLNTQKVIKLDDEYLHDIDLSWIDAGKTIYRNWLGLLLDSKT